MSGKIDKENYVRLNELIEEFEKASAEFTELQSKSPTTRKPSPELVAKENAKNAAYRAAIIQFVDKCGGNNGACKDAGLVYGELNKSRTTNIAHPKQIDTITKIKTWLQPHLG